MDCPLASTKHKTAESFVAVCGNFIYTGFILQWGRPGQPRPVAEITQLKPILQNTLHARARKHVGTTTATDSIRFVRRLVQWGLLVLLRRFHCPSIARSLCVALFHRICEALLHSLRQLCGYQFTPACFNTSQIRTVYGLRGFAEPFRRRYYTDAMKAKISFELFKCSCQSFTSASQFYILEIVNILTPDSRLFSKVLLW